MLRCDCGNNVLLNDDWENHPQYLDPDTRHPHRCPHNPMFNRDFWLDYKLEKIDPDNELLCNEHGLLQIFGKCPKKGCTSQGGIKRKYYNELKEKGMIAEDGSILDVRAKQIE